MHRELKPYHLLKRRGPGQMCIEIDQLDTSLSKEVHLATSHHDIFWLVSFKASPTGFPMGY